MCIDCRPEYLEFCYLCGRRFREFEPYFVVKRLMNYGGMESPHYGVKYGKCQNCPRGLAKLAPDWNALMGEGKRRRS